MFVFLCYPCFAQNSKVVNNTIYVDSDVDTLPSYPGGTEELHRFIMENYTVTQRLEQSSGSTIHVMIVNFIIDSSGKISDIRFNQSDPSTEQEMIRVIQKMPFWKPAITH